MNKEKVMNKRKVLEILKKIDKEVWTVQRLGKPAGSTMRRALAKDEWYSGLTEKQQVAVLEVWLKSVRKKAVTPNRKALLHSLESAIRLRRYYLLPGRLKKRIPYLKATSPAYGFRKLPIVRNQLGTQKKHK